MKTSKETLLTQFVVCLLLTTIVGLASPSFAQSKGGGPYDGPQEMAEPREEVGFSFRFGYDTLIRPQLEPTPSDELTRSFFTKFGSLRFDRFVSSRPLRLDAPANADVRAALDTWSRLNLERMSDVQLSRQLLERDYEIHDFTLAEATMYLAIAMNLMDDPEFRSQLAAAQATSQVRSQGLRFERDLNRDRTVDWIDTNLYRYQVTRPTRLSAANTLQFPEKMPYLNDEIVKKLKDLHQEMLALMEQETVAALSHEKRQRLALLKSTLWSIFIFHQSWELTGVTIRAVDWTRSLMTAFMENRKDGESPRIIPRAGMLPRPTEVAVLGGVTNVEQMPSAALLRYVSALRPETRSSWLAAILEVEEESGTMPALFDSDDNVSPRRLVVPQMLYELKEEWRDLPTYQAILPLAGQLHGLHEQVAAIHEDWSRRFEQYSDPAAYTEYYDDLYHRFYTEDGAREAGDLPRTHALSMVDVSGESDLNEQSFVRAANDRVWLLTPAKVLKLNEMRIDVDGAINYLYARHAKKTRTSWFYKRTDPTIQASATLFSGNPGSVESNDDDVMAPYSNVLRAALRVIHAASGDIPAEALRLAESTDPENAPRFFYPRSPLKRFVELTASANLSDADVEELAQLLRVAKSTIKPKTKDIGKTQDVALSPLDVRLAYDAVGQYYKLQRSNGNTIGSSEFGDSELEQSTRVIESFGHPWRSAARQALATAIARFNADSNNRSALESATNSSTPANRPTDEAAAAQRTAFEAQMLTELQSAVTKHGFTLERFFGNRTTFAAIFNTESIWAFQGLPGNADYPGTGRWLFERGQQGYNPQLYVTVSEILNRGIMGTSTKRDLQAEIRQMQKNLDRPMAIKRLFPELDAADRMVVLYLVQQGNGGMPWQPRRQAATEWGIDPVYFRGMSNELDQLLNYDLTPADAALAEIDRYLGDTPENMSGRLVWSALERKPHLIADFDLDSNSRFDERDYQLLDDFVLVEN